MALCFEGCGWFKLSDVGAVQDAFFITKLLHRGDQISVGVEVVQKEAGSGR